MKKLIAFFCFTLLAVSAIFAQTPTFPYQAVVRNPQNQLIKDSTFSIDVQVYQGAVLKYSETQTAVTNKNGQFSMMIGGGTLVSGSMNDVTDWSAAKFKMTFHLNTGDIVSEEAVHAVPYALQAANAASHTHANQALLDSYTQTEADLADAVAKKHEHANASILDATTASFTTAYETKLNGIAEGAEANVQADWNQTTTTADDYIKNKPTIPTTVAELTDASDYVTTTALNGNNYLTSDSTVITTMQSNITTLQGSTHSHSNASVLDATTASFTTADETKLDGIEEGAEANVQADWNQTTTTADDYIKNKPTIPEAANNATVTVKLNTVEVGSFTLDANADATIDILLKEASSRFSATAGQTTFVLAQTPKANFAVKMYINGIFVGDSTDGSDVVTVSGTTATYDSTNNSGYTLKAGDRVQFVFFY